MLPSTATYSIGSSIVRDKVSQQYNTSSADEHLLAAQFRREHPGLISSGEKCFESIFGSSKENKVASSVTIETETAQEPGLERNNTTSSSSAVTPNVEINNTPKSNDESTKQFPKPRSVISVGGSRHSRSQSSHSNTCTFKTALARHRYRSRSNNSSRNSNKYMADNHRSRSRTKHSKRLIAERVSTRRRSRSQSNYSYQNNRHNAEVVSAGNRSISRPSYRSDTHSVAGNYRSRSPKNRSSNLCSTKTTRCRSGSRSSYSCRNNAQSVTSNSRSRPPSYRSNGRSTETVSAASRARSRSSISSAAENHRSRSSSKQPFRNSSHRPRSQISNSNGSIHSGSRGSKSARHQSRSLSDHFSAGSTQSVLSSHRSRSPSFNSSGRSIQSMPSTHRSNSRSNRSNPINISSMATNSRTMSRSNRRSKDHNSRDHHPTASKHRSGGGHSSKKLNQLPTCSRSGPKQLNPTKITEMCIEAMYKLNQERRSNRQRNICSTQSSSLNCSQPANNARGSTMQTLADDVKELSKVVKENNRLLLENDRRLTRLEVTTNKMFILIRDVADGVNARVLLGNAMRGDIRPPKGFRMPKLPVKGVRELTIINREFKEDEYFNFMVNSCF